MSMKINRERETMKYYIGNIPYGNDLTHFGIKGQRWGVRRFQNPDGTWTAAGKARYSGNKRYEGELRSKSEANHKRISELQSRIAGKPLSKRLTSKESWKDAKELEKLRRESRFDDALLKDQVRRNEKFDRKYNPFGTSNKPNEASSHLDKVLNGSAGADPEFKRTFEKYGRSKTVNRKNVSFGSLRDAASNAALSASSSSKRLEDVDFKQDPKSGTLFFEVMPPKTLRRVSVAVKHKINGFDIAALADGPDNKNLGARAINEFEKELEKALNKR